MYSLKFPHFCKNDSALPQFDLNGRSVETTLYDLMVSYIASNAIMSSTLLQKMQRKTDMSPTAKDLQYLEIQEITAICTYMHSNSYK